MGSILQLSRRGIEPSCKVLIPDMGSGFSTLTGLQSNRVSTDPTTHRQRGSSMQTVIDFHDLQILNTVQSKMQVTRSALKANLSVIGTVSCDLEARHNLCSQSFTAHLSSLESQLQRVDALLTRSSTLTTHVSHMYTPLKTCQAC